MRKSPLNGCFIIFFLTQSLLVFSQSGSLENSSLNSNAGSEGEFYLPGTQQKMKYPLSLELASFTAIFTEKRVDISWATSAEHENDYFTVERSQDGVHFETASMIKSYGNNSGIAEYFETDYLPHTGISYYRLKQTDKEGGISFSPVIPVNYHFSESGGITIYPNPTDGPFNINFEINSKEETLVVIRDMKGEVHYTKVFLKLEGHEIIAIDPEKRLQPGVYLVMASSENKIYSQKLIVK